MPTPLKALRRRLVDGLLTLLLVIALVAAFSLAGWVWIVGWN